MATKIVTPQQRASTLNMGNFPSQTTIEEWQKVVGIPPIFYGVEPIDWENLLLIGQVGCGKSYKAAQMAYSLHKLGEFPTWVNIPKLLFDLRRNFDNEVVDKVLRKKYVVLDDLGAEHTTDWVAEIIYIIVNDAWEKSKNLIVASNLDVGEIANRFGDRLASRLVDVCKVEKMAGRDRRIDG